MDAGVGDVADYDVALLTLDRNLFFDDCTQPICLPSPEADPFATQGCQAAGWGALQCTYLWLPREHVYSPQPTIYAGFISRRAPTPVSSSS